MYMIQILKLEESPRLNKRFRIEIMDGDKKKHFDFGLDTGDTYLDHKDKTKRANYWKRHCGNKTEKRLIENLIPSPALFSARLLWGSSTNLVDNLKELQNDFE